MCKSRDPFFIQALTLEIAITLFFVCLELSSHSRIFHSFRDVTIAGEWLQILTYARNSWPLTSEGSLTCHTYCDMGLPISEDPLHTHLLPSVWQWSCHYLILRLMSVATVGSNPDIPGTRRPLYLYTTLHLVT